MVVAQAPREHRTGLECDIVPGECRVVGRVNGKGVVGAEVDLRLVVLGPRRVAAVADERLQERLAGVRADLDVVVARVAHAGQREVAAVGVHLGDVDERAACQAVRLVELRVRDVAQVGDIGYRAGDRCVARVRVGGVGAGRRVRVLNAQRDVVVREVADARVHGETNVAIPRHCGRRHRSATRGEAVPDDRLVRRRVAELDAVVPVGQIGESDRRAGDELRPRGLREQARAVVALVEHGIDRIGSAATADSVEGRVGRVERQRCRDARGRVAVAGVERDRGSGEVEE